MTTTPQSDPLTASINAIHESQPDVALAFLFPGQGSQQMGMGRDVAESSPAARLVFEAADEVLGFSLSRLCFDGPDDELTLTSNAQPAIMTTSLAIFAAAVESGTLARRPAYLAGHSLGQYTALVVAGALSFADALRLVRERGRLMAEAGESQPGTMAAIVGLDEEAVSLICDESGAEPCNYNLESQVVVGGTPEAVERARELAKERGGKGLPIKVSGAFHTSLMKPAADELADALRDVHAYEPAIPVISNVTGVPVAKDEVLSDLATQVIRPVRWHQSITYMSGNGVRQFVEIGSGQVLTAIMKRHSTDLEIVTLNSASALVSPSNV
jgi:[acyl-carrier-protein] S-malonyltransferase